MHIPKPHVTRGFSFIRFRAVQKRIYQNNLFCCGIELLGSSCTKTHNQNRFGTSSICYLGSELYKNAYTKTGHMIGGETIDGSELYKKHIYQNSEGIDAIYLKRFGAVQKLIYQNLKCCY